MHLHRLDFLLLAAIIGVAFYLAGCSSNPSPVPTSPAATPTTLSASPTAAIMTATPVSIDTVEPSPVPSNTPVLLPTVTLTLGPQPTATSGPASTGSGITRVKIFLIAMNDNGKSGELVGCGDSVIGVEREIPPTRAPLTAALNQLFSLHDQFYGQSGLYNALYRSNLRLSSAAIVNGRATINLTGQFLLGGECDDPRAEAQITQTALQFSTVRAVDVFVNGVPMKTLLSGK